MLLDVRHLFVRQLHIALSIVQLPAEVAPLNLPGPHIYLVGQSVFTMLEVHGLLAAVNHLKFNFRKIYFYHISL